MSTLASAPAALFNIAERLRRTAESSPNQAAVIVAKRHGRGAMRYRQLTFAELDDASDRIARGLIERGVEPGMRLVLFVPPGLEFFACTWGIFKCGAVVVLIDPGMGRSNIFRCLADVAPDGFVAIPRVHVIRSLLRKRFPTARHNVTVGRRVFWGGSTYDQLLDGTHAPFDPAPTSATDPAAIIFTSGSTGAPKGVLYEHGMFSAQADMIRDFYGIEPGEIDLSGFPLFALFNAAMGVTTIVPDMNPSRPADVDPETTLRTIADLRPTQAFGSPAFWNRVGRHCDDRKITLPTLRRIMTAGAPAPLDLLRRMRRVLSMPGADIHTPYGATECLPVASIAGGDVLGKTEQRSQVGGGICVGQSFSRVTVRVIEMTDVPIESIDDAVELEAGRIGEIIVQSPSATREYFRQIKATQNAKIPAGDRFWHRMGDVGYLDDEGRLWFCGRKAHVVDTNEGRLFSVPCESIINEHPDVYRTALVGVGARPNQFPVIVIEPEAGRFPESPAKRDRFTRSLHELAEKHDITRRIETFLFHRSLPVDSRHNVKINRELLAEWAAGQLGRATRT